MSQALPNVLITGFEPFGGERVNPSAQVALALHGRVIANHKVVSVVLPCVFGEALNELKKQLRWVKPVLVICLGQAGGRAAISVERVAINIDDARIADNAGKQPIDQHIAIKGPVAYWSTLPIKAIVVALKEHGIASEVSQTAGTFVCNHVFYGLMRMLQRKPIKGGFVHIPFAPEQVKGMSDNTPCMSVEMVIRGIELAIATSLRTDQDARISGGATH